MTFRFDPSQARLERNRHNRALEGEETEGKTEERGGERKERGTSRRVGGGPPSNLSGINFIQKYLRKKKMLFPKSTLTVGVRQEVSGNSRRQTGPLPIVLE